MILILISTALALIGIIGTAIGWIKWEELIEPWIEIAVIGLIAFVVLGITAGISQIDKVSEADKYKKQHDAYLSIINDETQSKDAAFYIKIKEFNIDLQKQQYWCLNPWFSWLSDSTFLEIELLPEN